MRLIARSVLLAYARTHPETAVPLERWYRLVKAANWTSMDDIRRVSPKAKVLNRDRARFEVAGELRWSRLSEQFFRVDKWSLCRG